MVAWDEHWDGGTVPDRWDRGTVPVSQGIGAGAVSKGRLLEDAQIEMLANNPITNNPGFHRYIP